MTHTNDPAQGRGALRQDQNALILDEGFSFSGYERDLVCLNQDGRKFRDISGVSGMDSITDGRAAVFADFDNDGDLDVFMTTIQGNVHLLFRNNVGQESNYLRVLLAGDREVGREALGSVVRVRTSAGTLTKIASGGEGFLARHDPRLLFGLGRDTRVEGIEVTWPNGKVERFEGIYSAGATVRLHKGSGKAEPMALPRAQLPDPLTRAETLARSLRIQLGQPLPDLPVKNLEGASGSLRAQVSLGRRALINLWATWCLPCAREMPELERLRPLLAERGIDLIGLNVDTAPEAPLQRFLEQTGVHYPIVLLASPAGLEQLYASEEVTVPLSLLVDEQGRVVEVIPGWSAETRRRLTALAGVEPSPSKKE